MLQWGRARASAEISRWSRSHDHQDPCFNGAALVRARKSPPPCGLSSIRERFNGAALVRARKWPSWPGPRRGAASGFNGAALVRARKCLARALLRENSIMLQWGRARASAEITQIMNQFLPEHGCFNGAALVRARKSASRRVGRKRASMLQWGRARASAEICCIAGLDGGAFWRFNGAALVRARK